MFNNDDNSGTFSVLIGLVILVFAAVGLSLVADKRFQFSSSKKRLEKEVDNQEEHIARLRAQERDMSSRLVLQEPVRQDNLRHLEEKKRVTAAQEVDLRQLAVAKQSLRKEIEALERQFTETRRETRSRIWKQAVGTRLPSLRTRDGREFEDVRITRVSAAGLVIRHSHGTARLRPEELEAAYQERFQWAKSRVSAGDPPARGTPSHGDRRSTPGRPPAPDPDELRKLREDLVAWNEKVDGLASERSEAAGMRAQGSRSVPGSLETWDARYKRLGRQLDVARRQQRAARSRLAEVAPRDPLLRQAGEEP